MIVATKWVAYSNSEGRQGSLQTLKLHHGEYIEKVQQEKEKGL